ncbi:hypothetical protein IEQ34_018635 [Dendrobium chrysotoxum]|uniref:Ubiquitin-like protease family profile domain-containing protein n=1 Tax=Dendrobium chrysotoxum TaxID=161865 RepID=A0AAV7G4K6_DENCH|nr:hypothetical protein IEQ34_018635 [Dendrobium chrysotoxum]
MKDKFQPYLYISSLYRESNLIVQPVVFKDHWTLIIGRLKEKITHLHEEKQGVFRSDITT